MKALFRPRAKRYPCVDLFAALIAETRSVILRIRLNFPDRENSHRQVGSSCPSGAVSQCDAKLRQNLAQFRKPRQIGCKWVSFW